jgi:hypothetical protein
LQRPKRGHGRAFIKPGLDPQPRQAVAVFLTQEEKFMSQRCTSVLLSTLLPLMFWGAAVAAPAGSEIKGAAILDHPCGKVAVKQMGLIHAGKFDEANKLTTKDMQEQWKSMPAKDKTMMLGMMQAMSESEEQYQADIKAVGLLVVDGPDATLTVQKKTQDANGSGTTTMSQKFKLDAGQCLISR